MSKLLHEILTEVDLFNGQVAHLKENSPIYPELYTEHKGNVFWVSTLVHWFYNDVLFSRHHVESGVLSKTCTEEMIISRLKSAADQCKEKAIPCKYDDVVSLNQTPKP